MKSCNKVCLIVDNPLRDLDGLVLLGSIMAREGTDVFLVPMYTQGYEIPAICPDFVLVNYVRKANTDLIKAYAEAGIMVGVLETEGGIWLSDEQYMKSIRHECASFIDLYCLWGKRQYDLFIKHGEWNKDKLVVTGHPRFDFYSYPWINTLDSIPTQGRPIVLINTSFSLSFPRFARNAGHEIRNLIKAGYKESYAKERVTAELRIRKDLLEVIKMLSTDFPNILFIIRPHPFENDREYHTSFHNLRNVQVRREHTIAPWAKAACLMLHLNSSTAVDAFLIGKSVVTIDWINHDIIRNMSKLTYDLSYKCHSYEELKVIIAESVQGDTRLRQKHYYDNQVKGDILALFHKIDGNAAHRIATSIFQKISQRRNKPSEKKCRNMVLYGSKNSKLVKGWIDGISRVCMGATVHDFLRTWIFTRNIGLGTKQDKKLNLGIVTRLLNKIQTISDNENDSFVSENSKMINLRARTCGNSIHIHQ